ncbi:MAG: alanine racemase [Myxococcota bacterium]|nr:alanine racemase [Myxococcota bacterium]
MRPTIRPTCARIDLTAVRSNYRKLAGLMGDSVRLFAAVKGDAYGHGACEVARALEQEGCEDFGVALVEEGRALREAGVRGRILCLGGAHTGPEEALESNLTPVLFDLESAKRFDALGRARGEPVKVHLKVDTGMGRLGVLLSDWPAFLDRFADLSHVRVEGIMTHFSDADDVEDHFTVEQNRRFEEALEMARARAFHPSVVHAANSAAAMKFPHLRHSMVRMGLSLYGIPPFSECPVKLDPVMRVTTEVLMVKNIPSNYGLSYSRSWRSQRPSRIATLPVGYADGYLRSLSNRGLVGINGQRCPVRGAVCMDMMMVDVTDCAERVRVGDEVELVGGLIGAAELASWAGTIPYEILTGWSGRVPRNFQGSAKTA